MTNIHSCVNESISTLYTKDINDADGVSTLQFSEETLHHRVLRDLLKEAVKDPNAISKNTILALVERARNA
jgi:hypothetical protein